jgi:arsenate reductase
MAEGWARALADSSVTVQSAGIEAHGKNPRAIQVMREAAQDISAQESTILTDDMLDCADYVVTVCGKADQNCPVLPAGVRKEHWPLDDPARARGTDDEILDVFRASRDEIRLRVVDLLERLKG